MIIPGKLGINYYMCTGEDPRSDYYSTKKVSKVSYISFCYKTKKFFCLKYPINAMLPMVSLLIYIGLSGKIALHRSRISRQLGLAPPMKTIEDKGTSATMILVPSTLESCPLTKMISKETKAKKNMKKKTSIPFIAILLLALTLIIESLLWSLVVNKLTPDQIMNTTLGTFMAYWHNNLGPMLFIWTFLALTYIKNPALLQSELISNETTYNFSIPFFSDLKELLNPTKATTEVKTFTI